MMGGKHSKPSWWRRGRDKPLDARRPRWFLTEMVDGDGFAHLVTSEEFEAGLSAGGGRYLVVCGRRITVASMASSPVHHCRPCQVLRATA